MNRGVGGDHSSSVGTLFDFLKHFRAAHNPDFFQNARQRRIVVALKNALCPYSYDSDVQDFGAEQSLSSVNMSTKHVVSSCKQSGARFTKGMNASGRLHHAFLQQFNRYF